jgi:hypothetical protein
MEAFLSATPIILAVLMAAVVIVMFMGLYTMGRGGKRGSKISNKMMRWRVGIQAVAIAVIGLIGFLTIR